MNFLLKSGFKELRNHLRFVVFFSLNLSLGLVGFILLNSFSGSIKAGLDSSLRNILAADISVFSRQPFLPEERSLLDALPEGSVLSERTSLFSMVSSQEQTVLARIMAIDENFPLYGELILAEGESLEEARRQLLAEPLVWMYADTREILQVSPGDTLQIGAQSYTVGPDLLRDPPGRGFGGFAPRLYMGRTQLEQAKLISFGSRVNYNVFVRLPDSADVEDITDSLNESKDAAQFANKSLRISSYLSVGNALDRVIDDVLGFLGLVAIVALFLAGVGASYLFRSYINMRMIDVAIFRSLGATARQSICVPLLQLLFLGIVSTLLATLMVAIILPSLEYLVANLIPKGLSFAVDVHTGSIWMALGIASLGSLFFCLPSIASALQVAPATLFRESVRSDAGTSGRIARALIYVPALLFLWLLAIWQVGLRYGSLFTALFLAALFLLGFVSWFVFVFCGRQKTKNPLLTIALRSLSRNRIAAISCFLSIGFGSFLLNTIPQVFNSIEKTLVSPSAESTPTLFLFDIQPEQIVPLKDAVAAQGFEFSDISPMVVAYMNTVNGKDPKVILEDDANSPDGRNMSTRSFNLSYRQQLSASEEIIAGRPFSGVFDPDAGKIAEISIEEEFAERNNLRLGDILVFDIFGEKVSGEIINLRKVKWNSFRPNFFILFQNGVLERFPHTTIGTVSGLSPEEKLAVRRAILKDFWNVSVIDVSSVVERIIGIADKASWAIAFMAYISVLTGLVVIFCISRGEAFRKTRELHLLKTLGARLADLRRVILIEYGLLIGFSSLVGLLLSWIVSAIIIVQILDGEWHLSLQSSIISLCAISVIGLGVILLAMRSTLAQKPWAVLRSP